MPITNAVDNGQSIIVYDENMTPKFSIPRLSGRNNGLKGYTGSTVNVQNGNTITTWNDQGTIIGSVPTRIYDREDED